MVSSTFYQVFIDPLLYKVHSNAVSLIPKGSKVIDIACGNGTLALKISSEAAHVTGIDLSAESINYAKKRAEKTGKSNVEFLEMDATDLSRFKDSEFDVATISMAVHQFRAETALRILKQLKIISKQVIVIDYNFPLPGEIIGLLIRTIELFAGKEHNRNFKSYLKLGGAHAFAESIGLKLENSYGSRKSIFMIGKSKSTA